MEVVSFTPRQLYPQGKSPWCPLDRRLGEPQSRSGRGDEKNSNPRQESNPRIPTVQPVAQHYTGWAIVVRRISKYSGFDLFWAQNQKPRQLIQFTSFKMIDPFFKFDNSGALLSDGRSIPCPTVPRILSLTFSETVFLLESFTVWVLTRHGCEVSGTLCLSKNPLRDRAERAHIDFTRITNFYEVR
jgi:hypothetical protein